MPNELPTLLVTRSLAAFGARRPPGDLYALWGGLSRLSLKNESTQRGRYGQHPRLAAVAPMRLFAARTRVAGAAQQNSLQGTRRRRWRVSVGAREVARWCAIIAAAGCTDGRPSGYPVLCLRGLRPALLGATAPSPRLDSVRPTLR